MKIAVVYFENQKMSIDRYPKFISNSIDFADNYFVYNIGNDIISTDNFVKTFKYTGSIKNIHEQLLDYNKIVVITMSYRPVDLIFITHLKSVFKDLISISIQHGIYADKLERSSLFSFFLNTYKRLVSYILVIFTVDVFKTFQKIIILKEIFYVYVLNKYTFKLSTLSKIFFLPENVLTLGKEWEKYYEYNFYNKYSPKFYIVPSMDDDLLNEAKYYNESVVIVAQSLIEDGRYSESKLLSEYELIFKRIPKHLKIFIKRHPRSNDVFFNKLSRPVIITDKLIVADYIISGYSSLMKTYSDLGCRVFSWKFIDHHNPLVFNNYSDLYGREDELISFFNLEKKYIIINKKYNTSKKYSNTIKKIIKK